LIAGRFDMQAHLSTDRGNLRSWAPASILEENAARVIGGRRSPIDGFASLPVVFVVDDDTDIRQALERRIRAKGWRCRTFASASAFLSEPVPAAPHCLLMDMNQSDVNGREVQQQIAARSSRMPVILLTDYDAIPPALRAIRSGAPEFLFKPFDEDALHRAVEKAIANSSEILRLECELRELQQRYASLSRREREVMDLVTVGLLNKQVGGRLGISEITVKAHRGQVMQKMLAGSFADLVAMSLWLRATPMA
jgi:FixJ family two-component response regulator